MLRKLIAFAITSGLAKKAWEHYRASKGRTAHGTRARPTAAARKATTVKPKPRATAAR